jgi:hypothetical protein
MRLWQYGYERVFGTCDIRGVIGGGLDSVIMRAIASVYGYYLCPSQPGHSLVGHDDGLKLCQRYAPSLSGENCLSKTLAMLQKGPHHDQWMMIMIGDGTDVIQARPNRAV